MWVRGSCLHPQANNDMIVIVSVRQCEHKLVLSCQFNSLFPSWTRVIQFLWVTLLFYLYQKTFGRSGTDFSQARCSTNSVWTLKGTYMLTGCCNLQCMLLLTDTCLTFIRLGFAVITTLYLQHIKWRSHQRSILIVQPGWLSPSRQFQIRVGEWQRFLGISVLTTQHECSGEWHARSAIWLH